MQPTQLYRAFGQRHGLLYVGVSLSALGRLAQHRTTAPWFGDCTLLTIAHHPDRASALAAERAAIELERPIFNAIARPPRQRCPRCFEFVDFQQEPAR